MPFCCHRLPSIWALLLSVSTLAIYPRGVDAQLAAPIDTLHLERTTAGAERIGYVASLAVAGDQLVVGDMKLNPHLARFDRRSLRLIGREGPDGTAMGQLREPSCITAKRDDDDHVWVFDRMRSVLTEVRIDGRTEGHPREVSLPGLPPTTVCATWANGRILLHSYYPDFLATTDSSGAARRSLDVPPPYKFGSSGFGVGRP